MRGFLNFLYNFMAGPGDHEVLTLAPDIGGIKFSLG
jgi:hypothetical protein